MRISACHNGQIVFPTTINDSAIEDMVRLPRRISKYFVGEADLEKQKLIWGYVYNRLVNGGLNAVLDEADEFYRRACAFRRRPTQVWHVGDPCYINGEGHGELFFVEGLQDLGMFVNGCRESQYKAYRPTFLELFWHLLRYRAGLRILKEKTSRWTPKELRELPRKIQREVKEAQAEARRLQSSLELLDAWMR